MGPPSITCQYLDTEGDVPFSQGPVPKYEVYRVSMVEIVIMMGVYASYWRTWTLKFWQRIGDRGARWAIKNRVGGTSRKGL